MTGLWAYAIDLDVPDRAPDGFDVVAEDEVIGTVVSAVRDTEASFLVVKTRGLLRKRQIVIPAGLVSQFSPSAERVFLRADRSIVETAPDHDDDWRSDPTWRDRTSGYFTT